MPIVQLNDVAQARSGDKGNKVDLGLFVNDEELYDVLLEQVTANRVKEHFEGLVFGDVFRYELPNILALKFVCEEALNGGGSSSIRVDNLGKTFGSALLRMNIEISDDLEKKLDMSKRRR
ncbi:hypothetical protein HUG15_02470 [Salicibibacter cibarius]|uniref:AtuA-like ferredoxin-fold domain-containing protein n=1 Tax=Salicibibacter cibarius TaxID=2743000 RepID=A0A7T6Z0T4_9BACI|nr:hypothetical protein [Salicibibacter cibarius]QQK74577.1 hypothetical protein HUG15_02470 [Salicibibacter cibarius]